MTLDGPRGRGTLLEYARTRKASRVLVRGAQAPRLARVAAAIDGDRARAPGAWLRRHHAVDAPTQPVQRVSDRLGLDDGRRRSRFNWERYGWALGTTAVCTAVAFAHVPVLRARQHRDGVHAGRRRLRASRFGRGPAIVAAIANVVAFDFCFVPPRFTFAVSDVQYLVTFVVMLIVTLVIATLMASVRQQTRVAGARERRTALLYAMSRELAATRGLPNMARVAVTHVAEVFDCQAVDAAAGRERAAAVPARLPLAWLAARRGPLDRAMGGDHGQRAGLGSDTLPAAPALYLPLSGASADAGRARGAAGQPAPRAAARAAAPARDLRRPDRARARARRSSRMPRSPRASTAETESLRNTLLASISHDLRTPLAVIAGAGSTLADPGADARRRDRAARSRSRSRPGARDMSDLISNVLDLMRLRVRPHRAAARLADARRPGRRGAGARRGAAARPPCRVDAARRTCRPCTSTPR